MILNTPQQVDHIDAKEEEPEPHVLAVDDNLIDRKIVEKLLKNSSCKGNLLVFYGYVTHKVHLNLSVSFLVDDLYLLSKEMIYLHK